MVSNRDRRPKPPVLATWILQRFCKDDLVEEIVGDLEEYFLQYSKKYPMWRARLYYWFHVVSFLRPYSLKKSQKPNNWIMLISNLKFSVRYLSKHRTNTLLNITSLSVGIGCFIFISIYLKEEISFDTFHKDHERIHRVVIDFVNDGVRIPDATSPPALSVALKEKLPEVEFSTRLFPTWGSKYLVWTDPNSRFYEEEVLRVDPDFLHVFDFKIIDGNKDELLNDPSKVVLSERMVSKYFGDVNPIGKEIVFNRGQDQTYIVSGILENIPSNSHFSFDFLMPLHITSFNIDESWGWYNFYTYIKLKENTDQEVFEGKLQPLYDEYNVEEDESNIIYSQQLADIHLKSALKWELGSNNNMSNIRIFSAIGIFIVLISFINFLNLTIGNLIRRTKEVGVRISFGAKRGNLMSQFVIEILIVSMISVFIGILLAEVFLRSQADLFGREVELFTIENLTVITLLVGSIVLLSLCISILPALQFASLKKVNDLFRGKSSRLDIKKILLIAQFMISSIMLVGTVTVYQQLNFFRNTDKGFSMDQVLVVENASAIQNQGVLLNKLNEIPGVEEAGLSDGVIGKINWTFTVGYPNPFLMNYTVVTPSYFETMEIEFVEGRNFNEEIETDGQGLTMIINETALKAFGVEKEKIGESIVMDSENDSLVYGKILGVVRDFHFADFKSEIKPYAFFYREESKQNLTLRLNPVGLGNTIDQVEGIWNEMVMGVPFESYFLDQSFARLHASEERLSKVMLYLTILSIFISVIGMLSIVNIVIKNRLKEVAVRKVLGASVNNVVQLLTNNFLMLVILANLIGLPIAYFMIKEWLTGFAYRIELGPGLFIFSIGLTLVLVMITVGFRSFQAATTKLTDRLRDE